jgi:hypothetical protein
LRTVSSALARGAALHEYRDIASFAHMQIIPKKSFSDTTNTSICINHPSSPTKAEFWMKLSSEEVQFTGVRI